MKPRWLRIGLVLCLGLTLAVMRPAGKLADAADPPREIGPSSVSYVMQNGHPTYMPFWLTPAGCKVFAEDMKR